MRHQFATPTRSLLVLVLTLSLIGVANGSTRALAAECPSGWVALTYDDGPVTGRSEMVLEALNRTNTPATFFSVGRRVARNPDLAMEMVQQGHVMANHTWAHLDLTSLSPREVVSSVRRTDVALRAIGILPLRLVRPPFLRTNETVLNALEHTGFVQILESVNSKDWSDITPDQIVERVVSAAHDGAVIGLHDGHSRFAETAIATEIIIERLTSEGFCFGVLDEQGDVVQPSPIPYVSGLSSNVQVNEMMWINYLMGS